jgi:hypothetical protein
VLAAAGLLAAFAGGSARAQAACGGSAGCGASEHTVTFQNNCDYPVWIANAAVCACSAAGPACPGAGTTCDLTGTTGFGFCKTNADCSALGGTCSGGLCMGQTATQPRVKKKVVVKEAV